MRIGIDCREVVDQADGKLAGVGYYTFSLVEALVKRYPEHEFVVFVHSINTLTDSMRKLSREENVHLWPVAQNGRIPFWTSHVEFARAIQKAKCDVFHAPAYVAPLGLRHVPTVVTIHDLAIYEHPEWFAKQSPLSRKVFVPRSISKAAAVIAVSRATAAQVASLFPEAEEKTHVVYEAAVLPEMTLQDVYETMSGLRQYYHIHNQYLFFVGTIEPRKNLVRVIRAFEQAARRVQERSNGRIESVQLVLAGRIGWKYQDVLNAIATADVEEHQVQWIDYVSQAEKIALMNDAAGVVMASLDEGFGLPALEAMQLGTPVIASREGALGEITGGHALIVDPYNESDIATAMERVFLEPEQMRSITERAQEYAMQYTWERAAEQTMDIYTQVTR